MKSADEGGSERIGMETLYELRIQIEELDDGGDYRYLGTSPDLPNLVVVGDSVEEVVANAPGVARALLETMQEHGLPIPSLAEARQPYVSWKSTGKISTVRSTRSDSREGSLTTISRIPRPADSTGFRRAGCTS